ncbi:MAG TPA: RNA polymerase sigma-70 factor [Prolixibacteraceae bacterium]|nr:RNA polymerase sigma-70 factor [Prolixibacteraceae bacterium]HPR60388.1 RNA polymerase sigma-70 factor [Prolixibacteraceae bacterium]
MKAITKLIELMPDNYHEKILIDALKEGNQQIFEYLFHLYYSGLVVFSIKYVGNREAAEDIVQDFFVTTWAKRQTLNISQSIKSYFFTSVRNRSLDYLRHLKIKQKASEVNDFNEIQNQTDDFIIESELRQILSKAINKLPPTCKEIFLMNRFEGITPSNIAIHKNISVRTVEGHIGKALKILRTELGNHLPLVIVGFLIDKIQP